MLTGWKTLIFNCAYTMLPVFLQWVMGIDWTQYVSPTTAIMIGGVANFALRFVTSTPVFRKAKK